MEPAHDDLESSLLRYRPLHNDHTTVRRYPIIIIVATFVVFGLLFSIQFNLDNSERVYELKTKSGGEVVQSEVGVVAADDGYCSETGASILRKGGHAVDALVATAICEGIRHPMSSGIGGGAFIVVRSAKDGKAFAFDARETAPIASSRDMYQNNHSDKCLGPLSIGIPGEVAGLHAIWKMYGKLPWKSLFQPSIDLLRNGFKIVPYLDMSIREHADKILSDPGLREVFAPNGRLLRLNDTLYNYRLVNSLETIAREGPQALYSGSIGEKFIQDVRDLGGIITMDDMENYKVEVTEALSGNALGYTIIGMPPPSTGTVGISMVLNILGSYKTLDAVKGLIGIHRLIEAIKHTLGMRMNLGDPNFVNITEYVNDMLSPTYAEKVKERIFDNTTFDLSYYSNKWSQLSDHGTSHVSIVDSERNAVSFTSTINEYFGAGVMSPATGIIANNEMCDFATPTDETVDDIPPAPTNFIEPNKRPLSSMSPLIILKDDNLAGVIGASGGMNIIPAIAQVLINYFILGMDPLKAVQYPRFYHRFTPNVVLYENYTAVNGENFMFPEAAIKFLEERHHQLQMKAGVAAVCQFVVQNLTESGSSNANMKNGGHLRGMLTAVSDPRKDGSPACV
uniref:Glutathione hydrolase n=1 Tax=Allium sativum TaxID=4682 RepID=A0A0B6VJH4_ALLSA|nr:gamma-glutamyl transpeptidase [Allium sativum]